MKEYLTNKDCAKILFNLYEKVFNRLLYEPVYCETEVTEEQMEKYSSSRVTEEEIWAYENKIMYVSDGFIENRLEKISDRTIQKRAFLIYTCLTACKVKEERKVIYTEELEELSVKYGFFKKSLKVH